jgi:uncharacterized damage-inducible protein DinB
MAAMAHPLVDQLRFTRGEWLRALRGISEEDGLTRLEPMNSIGWIVFHLAWQEQLNLLTRLDGRTPVPSANVHGVNGEPASTPALAEAMNAWRAVTLATDRVLDGLDEARLAEWLPNAPRPRLIGSAIQRIIYHYWFHIGEITAIRQVLGHAEVPEFVGDIDGLAPWRHAPTGASGASGSSPSAGKPA